MIFWLLTLRTARVMRGNHPLRSKPFRKREAFMARSLQTPSQTPDSCSADLPTEETVLMQRRLLIAEDNELTRQQLKQLLEADEHIQVDTTGDGSEALEKLVEH